LHITHELDALGKQQYKNAKTVCVDICTAKAIAAAEGRRPAHALLIAIAQIMLLLLL